MTKVIKGMQWWCHLTAVYGREEHISMEVVMWFQLCHPCGFLWHGKLHDVSSATNSAGLSFSGDIAFLLLLFMNCLWEGRTYINGSGYVVPTVPSMWFSMTWQVAW